MRHSRPYSRAEPDAHFGDTAADWLCIARMTGHFESIDPGQDQGAAFAVLQVVNPFNVGRRLDELRHTLIVSYGRHIVNYRGQSVQASLAAVSCGERWLTRR
jgi:hypothetical protein